MNFLKGMGLLEILLLLVIIGGIFWVFLALRTNRDGAYPEGRIYKKPFDIKDIFSFNGYVSRSTFAIRFFVIISISILINLMAESIAIDDISLLLSVVMLIVICLVIWANISNFWRRIKDTDYNPWVLLLIIVPIANFILLISLFIKKSKLKKETPEIYYKPDSSSRKKVISVNDETTDKEEIK